MAATKLKNTLKDKEVQIREGNAGVTRLMTTLKPGASTTVRSDPNATYREYFLITLPDNSKLPTLSSDDFADYKEINIFEEGGKLDWKGTVSRRPARAVVASPVEAQVGSPQPQGFIKRMLNKFGL